MTNYMKDVAQLLGVELGQEFEVDMGNHTAKAVITDKDMYVLCGPPDWERHNSAMLLKKLLCGHHTIVKP